MSAPVTAASLEPTNPLGDAATRGLTRISPNVVERIAAHACQRADAVVTPHGRPESTRAAVPRARAEITGKVARLSVSVSVRYPSPITACAASVRGVVTEDVERLCGLRVVGVDVEASPVNLRRKSRVQ